MGGYGVYLNLEGTEGVNDCYICEVPPGKSLEPQKHMFEEMIFVVGGRGATTVWRDGGKKQTFEWGEGALFSPPLNTWYQHFNGHGDKPVRLLAMTNAPTILNLFHNIDFVFKCDYPFTDRYDGEEDFFSGNAKVPAEGFSDTNFIRDVKSFELVERKDRGVGGRMIMIEMANNVMSAHISQFPVRTYKKAHRHGAGAHVIILRGEGFSVMWPEGKDIQRYNWRAGSLLVPPERWFHQHFNVGAEPARYLALKPFSSHKFPGLRKQWGTSESVKTGGDQIEYEDEELDVEVIRMNVPNIITALVTGDIGYTLIFGSVVRGALRGMPMRAVASLLDSPTHALIAKPEYKSGKELKGKTVGIGNFGGTDEVAGRMMLKSFGLDTDKDLKFIALGPDRARLAALKEGLVDVAVIAPPGDALGKQMGFNVLLRAYEVFSFPFIGIGANLKTIKERPEEVKKVVKAMIRANRFIREDKEGAVKVLMEWGKVERDHAVASYDSTWRVFSPDGNIPQEGLRLVIDQAKAELKLTRDVPLNEIIDVTPLREAQKELGLRK